MSPEFRLRELLDRAHITQSDFAKKADLSFATVNRLCRNTTAQVHLETLDKILRALEAADVKADLHDVISIKPAEPRKRR